MTPRELLLMTAKRFREGGVPDPMTDAAELLAMLTGRRPLELRLDTDTALTDDLLARYNALCEQRLKRVPLQYLTGEVIFLGHAMRTDSRALIPRPETELLAQLAVDRLEGVPEPRVLDLCCGTGCIGLSVALIRPDVKVTLADLSEDALALAWENAAQLGVAVAMRHGDLFEALTDDAAAFDLIVSNPPYIPSGECPALQAEVRYEPLMALDGGADGLDFYRRIAVEALPHIKPGGRLLLELGNGEAEAVSALMKDAGWTDIQLHRDEAGILRMLEAVRRRDLET